MASNWGDDIDEELKNREKISVGFVWNFISMNNMLTRLDQEVGEADADYPKSEYMKLWGSSLVMIQILAICTRSILVIATLPFIFFHLFMIFKIAGGLKRFGYPRKGYWLMTILLLIVIFAVAALVQFFVLKNI